MAENKSDGTEGTHSSSCSASETESSGTNGFACNDEQCCDIDHDTVNTANIMGALDGIATADPLSTNSTSDNINALDGFVSDNFSISTLFPSDLSTASISLKVEEVN